MAIRCGRISSVVVQSLHGPSVSEYDAVHDHTYSNTSCMYLQRLIPAEALELFRRYVLECPHGKLVTDPALE